MDSDLAPESLTGEAICGLGLVSLHIEGKLCGQWFAISKNHLALGGVVPARSASAQDIKAAKMKNAKMLGRTREAMVSITPITQVRHLRSDQGKNLTRASLPTRKKADRVLH